MIDGPYELWTSMEFEVLMHFKQTWCSRGYSTNTFVIDWVSQSVSHSFALNFQNIINHKPEELRSWNFAIILTPHNYHMSCVMCHMSHVIYHMSGVTCDMWHVICHVWHIIIFFYIVLKLSGETSRRSVLLSILLI